MLLRFSKSSSTRGEGLKSHLHKQNTTLASMMPDLTNYSQSGIVYCDSRGFVYSAQKKCTKRGNHLRHRRWSLETCFSLCPLRGMSTKTAVGRFDSKIHLFPWELLRRPSEKSLQLAEWFLHLLPKVTFHNQMISQFKLKQSLLTIRVH